MSKSELHGKEKFDADRTRFLDEAMASDDGQWTKHTVHHWSRQVNGERLDYWPSRKKFQWAAKLCEGFGRCIRSSKEINHEHRRPRQNHRQFER